MQSIDLGGGTTFDRIQHLRISCPSPARILDVPRDASAVRLSLGDETRHVVIHDVHAVGWWATGVSDRLPPAEMYNVLIYNIGYYVPDDPIRASGQHGHALYTQNYGSSRQKNVDTCVLSSGFGVGLGLYGTNSDISTAGESDLHWASSWNKLANYQFRNTIFAGDRNLVGGEKHGAHQITFSQCDFLGGTLQMGYQAGNGDGQIQDCHFTCPFHVSQTSREGYRHPQTGNFISWRNLLVRQNTFILSAGQKIDVSLPAPDWDWDNNTYYSVDEKPFHLHTQNPEWTAENEQPFTIDSRLSFAEWQAQTGFDRNSTFTQVIPPEPLVRVLAVAGGEEHLANVSIINPASEPSVEVDLSTLNLQPGARYVLRQARDFDNDIREFVYSGQPVQIEMSGTVAPPLNWIADFDPPGIAGTQFPYMGIFRVETAST